MIPRRGRTKSGPPQGASLKLKRLPRRNLLILNKKLRRAHRRAADSRQQPRHLLAGNQAQRAARRAGEHRPFSSTNTVPGSICSGIHSLIMLNSPIIMPPPPSVYARHYAHRVTLFEPGVKTEPVPQLPSSCATESPLEPGGLRRSGIYRTSAAARFLTGPQLVAPMSADKDECRR